ncbi:GspE/PulE family protein [Sedimenticola selenatireducens]|uniref:MSHA biogenesis protein MshE n=1 Tax=Sedimenticola selenatireducens TaxID=191960 RepID=A0A2N6D1S5_9GAMM|nr:GspE/PulE family protein [Sedimenticola selenatireducens]PLX63656.1 MAG: MSHA biogenesis protein MshE [Sedimenticola selenatireducens]
MVDEVETNPTDVTRSRKRIRIGDLLVENRVISEGQLQAALAEQKRSGHKLGHTLIELGFIDEQRLLDFLSQQLQIPYIDLTSYPLQPEVVKSIQETLARRYRVIVLENRDKDVLVGMADPTDLFAYDELGHVLKKRVRQAVVRESDLLEALDRMYRRSEELTSLAGELHEDLTQGDFDLGQLMQTVEAGDAPVIRLLQTLFEDALQAKASDIHIEPDEEVLRIRQRIDGVLHEQVMNERRIAPALVQRLKLLASLDISEKRLPQDGRFQIKVKRHSIDVRLSTMPVQHGEAVVMRLLDQSSGILSLDDLGFEQGMLQRLRLLIKKPHGMVLVTGPTGSGKTTTLYSALNELNTAEKKIITVEDPVEYRLPRVNQVQVHEQIGLNFARVLRTALRQDPDILLVGEMRDLETAQIGLRAAITGHFVLSTVHTNSAIGTVSRLLDMGAPGYLMASSLLAIVAQRLVRRVCSHCAVPYEPDQIEQAWLEGVQHDYDLGGLRIGRGCNRCSNTGYRGRVGVYELLELNGEMASALRRDDHESFTRIALASKQFEPLWQSVLQFASQGVTTLSEAMRISGDVDGGRRVKRSMDDRVVSV